MNRSGKLYLILALTAAGCADDDPVAPPCLPPRRTRSRRS